MPRLEAGFTGADASEKLKKLGPTLQVHVGFDPVFDPAVPSTVNLPADPILALIDTGADIACIDDDLAKKLGLPVVDRATCSGAGGSREANVYAAQIVLPDGYVIHGRFAGVKLQAGGQSYQVLLGRSNFVHYTIIYDGPSGSCVMHRD